MPTILDTEEAISDLISVRLDFCIWPRMSELGKISSFIGDQCVRCHITAGEMKTQCRTGE